MEVLRVPSIRTTLKDSSIITASENPRSCLEILVYLMFVVCLLPCVVAPSHGGDRRYGTHGEHCLRIAKHTMPRPCLPPPLLYISGRGHLSRAVGDRVASLFPLRLVALVIGVDEDGEARILEGGAGVVWCE